MQPTTFDRPNEPHTRMLPTAGPVSTLNLVQSILQDQRFSGFAISWSQQDDDDPEDHVAEGAKGGHGIGKDGGKGRTIRKDVVTERLVLKLLVQGFFEGKADQRKSSNSVIKTRRPFFMFRLLYTQCHRMISWQTSKIPSL